MVVAFAIGNNVVCTGCVLATHGSLGPAQDHGITVACNHRGTPIVEEQRTLPALAVTDITVGQSCSRCGKVMGRTHFDRLAAFTKRLRKPFHRRANPRGYSAPEHATSGATSA
jgi:hypothetical protein